MNKLNKIWMVLVRNFIKLISYVSIDKYMSLYAKYLKKVGVCIEGKPKFISKDVYFDGTDYSLIHIGDNVTISREVMLLTHDYSLTTAVCSLGKYIDRHQGEMYFKKEITIGRDCFIGARASILPGTKIGNNCIIGACAVVKGNIPDDSIVVGNPAKIIGSVKEYATEHLTREDFFVE